MTITEFFDKWAWRLGNSNTTPFAVDIEDLLMGELMRFAEPQIESEMTRMGRIINAERQRCANIAKYSDSGDVSNKSWDDGYHHACDEIEAKIRNGE